MALSRGAYCTDLMKGGARGRNRMEAWESGSKWRVNSLTANAGYLFAL
jgi:hypothetical protein